MRARQLFAFLFAPAAFLVAPDASTSTPCPPNSAGDRAFSFASDATSCVFGKIEGNTVGSAQPRVYNVYCPGRMTPADAERVGRALADGSLLPSSPIRTEFKAMDSDPHFDKIDHRFHYSCQSGGRSCVATHIKVLVRRGNVFGTPVPIYAKHCQQINQSGGVFRGSNLERQYRCALHFLFDGRNVAQETTKHLFRNDSGLLAGLRANDLKLCVLASTDIQCAPCY